MLLFIGLFIFFVVYVALGMLVGDWLYQWSEDFNHAARKHKNAFPAAVKLAWFFTVWPVIFAFHAKRARANATARKRVGR